MSIYNNPYQIRSHVPGHSPHVRNSNPKVSSILHVNTNLSINERIHLVKERAHLKGLPISSAPDTKSLSKRVLTFPTSHSSPGILIPKPNEPVEIKFFTKLQILDVSYNTISSIPEWIYSLKNLKVLDISENKIKKLSSLIGNLNKLESLIIRDNELKKNSTRNKSSHKINIV